MAAYPVPVTIGTNHIMAGNPYCRAMNHTGAEACRSYQQQEAVFERF